MESKFTKKGKKVDYTVVYLDIKKDLQIDFTEYLVLQAMLNFSNKNVYSKGVSKLSTYLKISRNTTYKCLNTLFQKGHITNDDLNSKIYYLKYDIRERFESSDNLYVKIYHEHRKELKLSIKQYVFLYMIYSLSKKVGKSAIAGKKMYCKNINFSESHFATSKSLLIKYKLLEPQGNLSLKLSEEIFEWFKNN